MQCCSRLFALVDNLAATGKGYLKSATLKQIGKSVV